MANSPACQVCQSMETSFFAEWIYKGGLRIFSTVYITVTKDTWYWGEKKNHPRRDSSSPLTSVKDLYIVHIAFIKKKKKKAKILYFTPYCKSSKNIYIFLNPLKAAFSQHMISEMK